MHTASIRLGLRENLGQFSLLVLVNVFVGAMVGLERSILPAIAEQDFHITARAAILSFIVVFGVTKALTNYCISQAGLVNNLNDGVAWGLFPLVFAAAGMTSAQVGILAAIYPAVWGASQIFTGALSDRIGRKWLIFGGCGYRLGALP